MLIHEKVVLPDNLFRLCAYLGGIAAPATFLFSQLRQETALRLLRKNRMKMMANREDVFSPLSNHRACS
jgi:hypothetical protein